MNFYIPKHLLGFDFDQHPGFHLVYDQKTKKYHKSIKTPLGIPAIDSPEMREIDEIYHLDLFSSGLSTFPVSEKWKNVSYSVFKNNKKAKDGIPWCLVLPSESYKQEIKQYTQQLKLKLGDLNIDYHTNTFCVTDFLFKNLQPAMVNVQKIHHYLNISEHIHNKTFLQSFLPEDVDFPYSRWPRYNRTKTKTGRLTIDSSSKTPNILLLQKECRDILVSRHGPENGKILHLDYKSLEPRVLLAYINNIYSSYVVIFHLIKNVSDIYQMILDKIPVKNTDLTRDLIKLIVLRKIYGTADGVLVKELKSHGLTDSPRDLINMISDMFHLQDIQKKLFEDFKANNEDYIENFYGRPIACQGESAYKLINYFTQSTAVDVALQGFTKMVRWIVENEKLETITPLFVLHDALILDVHNSEEKQVHKLIELGSKDIPGMEQMNFFIEKSQI